MAYDIAVKTPAPARPTLALTCCRKRERGTSGRWRQSGAALCSARELTGTPALPPVAGQELHSPLTPIPVVLRSPARHAGVEDPTVGGGRTLAPRIVTLSLPHFGRRTTKSGDGGAKPAVTEYSAWPNSAIVLGTFVAGFDANGSVM